MADYYGPVRPEHPFDYDDFPTPPYLDKVGNKIKKDLEKWFRLYNAKKCLLYEKSIEGTRCTDCTDQLTGAVVLSECETCGGTGYVTGYTFNNIYYGYVEIAPINRNDSEAGLAEINKSIVRLLCDTPLKDEDLVAFVDTNNVYKILDQSPQIVAVQGNIIFQTANISRMEERSHEYRQIDWTLGV